MLPTSLLEVKMSYAGLTGHTERKRNARDAAAIPLASVLWRVYHRSASP